MFIKKYPYLLDSYIEDADTALKKRDFLASLDNFLNQKRYVKMTLLNWDEEPIKEIAGDITGGTITKDGTSSFRTSCSLSTTVDSGKYNIEDAEMDFSINKKIFIELGVKNYSNDSLYGKHNYPILWFPQGIFFIKSYSCNNTSTSTLEISLSLIDKMAMLSGDVGGTFPAPTILDTVDTQEEDGTIVEKKVPIYQIIQEVVSHIGGESLNNIVIEDVPLKIKRVVQWTGNEEIYIYSTTIAPTLESNENIDTTDAYIVTTEKPSTGLKYTFSYGDDIGYIYDDFVWPDELVANAGETVVSVLEQIKSVLGNYEYFYDNYGVFHFREIKNYVNTTQAKVLVNDMTTNDYMISTVIPKETFTFSDDNNLISVNASPEYGNIKNDYVVQGVKQDSAGNRYMIRYHLAIDDKPQPGNTYENIVVYIDPETGYDAVAKYSEREDLDIVGEFNTVYKVGEEFYYWNGKTFTLLETKENGVFSDGYKTVDWREELYMKGLEADKNAIQANYYFAEMKYNFPASYDFVNHKWYDEAEDENILNPRYLTNGTFFIDFIDAKSSPLGKYSVNSIGRRSDIVVSEEVNCLFQPIIPDIVYVEAGNEDSLRIKFELDPITNQFYVAQGQALTQVSPIIYNNLETGGYLNGAFAQIKYELFLHTNFQRSVSLSAIANFYLEPNARVKINDKATNTYGDFIVKTISIPLDMTSPMGVTCSEVFERF